MHALALPSRVAAKHRLNKVSLLLHLILGIDDIFLAAAALWAVLTRARSLLAIAAGALAFFLVQVLSHRVRGLLQLLDRLPDRAGVVLARCLLDLLDGRLDGGPIGVADLGGVFLEELLHLVNHLIRMVAGIDQLELALVLIGMALRLLPHALDFGLAQATRAFDADLFLLARAEVLGRDV